MKAIVVDKDYGSVKPEELDVVEAAYAQAGITLERMHLASEDEIITACGDAQIILGTGNPPITARVIESLPNLKFIQRFGVGVNSIDLNAEAEHGVIVFFLPGFCAKELADLAFAMIMGLIRNTAYYDREIRAGKWPKCEYLLPPDIRNMTLGLFGFGAAGSNLCKILHGGFGCKVLACDPYAGSAVKEAHPEVEFTDFDTLLTQSDIISLHAALTPETHHIFNKDAFRKMKSTAMIINTSRGPLIDQKDLAWALQNGEIRYAGLDTMEIEPIDPADPLLKMDNVILSPHNGSYGEGAKKTQIEMVCTLVPDSVTKGIVPARCVANRKVMESVRDYQFT